MRWDERLHDKLHLPGVLAHFDDVLEERLDTRLGWKLRRWASPLADLVWLTGRTPPSRIGYAPGPLQALRDRRHRRLDRPVRICLLEEHREGARFGPAQAYWINRRSRVCSAAVNTVEGADVVWVFSQDPLEADVRARLERVVAGLPPTTVVLNPLDVYDAYHDDETFDRLRTAGVSVPRRDFGTSDLGSTPVVYKVAGEQSCRKTLRPWQGPLPGHRAFAYVDGRGEDGLHRRYRAFYVAGVVEPWNVIASREWNVSSDTGESTDLVFELTSAERDQVARIAHVLGLDYFAVDFLRSRPDGAPVFVDINVYPTNVVATAVDRRLGCRGRWHVLDTRNRLGVEEPDGSTFWKRFDEAVMARVAEHREKASMTA